MESFLLKGILIGSLFGMPVGAIGAMTVQRTLNYGLREGLLTGLGSSAADCFYAVVGAFGLTIISDFLLAYQTVIHIVGGVLVLLLGIRSFLRKEVISCAELRPASGIKMFLASFMIGITNPAAILTFLFAFSYFGISGPVGRVHGLQLVGGVFVGTYIWWSVLSAGVCLLKKKAKMINLLKVNRGFGIILMLFGAAVFIRALISRK